MNKICFFILITITANISANERDFFYGTAGIHFGIHNQNQLIDSLQERYNKEDYFPDQVHDLNYARGINVGLGYKYRSFKFYTGIEESVLEIKKLDGLDHSKLSSFIDEIHHWNLVFGLGYEKQLSKHAYAEFFAEYRQNEIVDDFYNSNAEHDDVTISAGISLGLRKQTRFGPIGIKTRTSLGQEEFATKSNIATQYFQAEFPGVFSAAALLIGISMNTGTYYYPFIHNQDKYAWREVEGKQVCINVQTKQQASEENCQ